jgi:hypothetical protein
LYPQRCGRREGQKEEQREREREREERERDIERELYGLFYKGTNPIHEESIAIA